jgi:amidase
LVINEHPLCPTAASVAEALNGLIDRLANLGVHIVRDSPKLPDLALTTRTYVELLAAFFVADLMADTREAVVATAQSLSADDRSIAACRVRGFTISHADWILATDRAALMKGRGILSGTC